jgi:hypothetical protein
MSKWLFQYPEGAAHVKERFPPLRDRLTTVNTSTLFEELGKGYHISILSYPLSRDTIVLKELFKRRPPTQADLRRILVEDPATARFPPVVNHQRMRAFLSAIDERKDLPRYAPMLARVFLDPNAESSGHLAVRLLMSRMKSIDADFSRESLTFLENGLYVAASLYHLEQTVQSEETLRRLASIPVAVPFERSKGGALTRIRERIKEKERAQELK